MFKYLIFLFIDGDETVTEKIRKAGERVRRRAISGAVLRELKEEYLDAPIEDKHGLAEKQASLGRENKRKIEYEENYMTRLPVTKQEKHRRHQITTLGTLGEEITTFGESSSVSAKKRKAQKKGKAKKSKLFCFIKYVFILLFYLLNVFIYNII